MLVRYLFQDKLVNCQVHFVSVSLWVLIAKRKEGYLSVATLLSPVFAMLGKPLFQFLLSYFEVLVNRIK